VILELNPVKWFGGKKPGTVEVVQGGAPGMAVLLKPHQVLSQEVSTSAKAVETKMSNKFVGFLETVGKGFMKGLGWATKEAPAVSGLAALLFPGSVAVSAPLTVGLNLLQNTILTIEQKYAASGVQSGTGAQKTAEVLALAAPAAASLLTQAGVPGVDEAYIGQLVSAIVGILNVHPTPAA